MASPCAATKYCFPTANGNGCAHGSPVETVTDVRPRPFHALVTVNVARAMHGPHLLGWTVSTVPRKRRGASSASLDMDPSGGIISLPHTMAAHGPEQHLVVSAGTRESAPAHNVQTATTRSDDPMRAQLVRITHASAAAGVRERPTTAAVRARRQLHAVVMQRATHPGHR